jgi:hypothetical protein
MLPPLCYRHALRSRRPPHVLYLPQRACSCNYFLIRPLAVSCKVFSKRVKNGPMSRSSVAQPIWLHQCSPAILLISVSPFHLQSPRHLVSLPLVSIFGYKSRDWKKQVSLFCNKRKRCLIELTDLNIFTATSTLGPKQLRMNPRQARSHLNDKCCNAPKI